MTSSNSIDFHHNHTIDFSSVCDRLDSGERFKLSRFGDGEWNCILGRRGSNCDGHQYFPDLGEELARIVRANPGYHLAIFQIQSTDAEVEKLLSLGETTKASAMRKKIAYRREVEEWCRENGVFRRWCNNGMFHVAHKRGEIGRMWQVVPEDALLVGPARLARHRRFDMGFHVEIPVKNCWESRTDILEEVTDRIANHSTVLFCAGMPSCWFVHQLRHFDRTIIDLGSVLDPYCGVQSRSFFKKV